MGAVGTGRAAAAAIALLLASAGAAASVEGAPPWIEAVALTLSERLRGELVDWFRSPAAVAGSGAGRYVFLGSQLRAGARITLPRAQLGLELQDTRLARLPDDAVAPPLGALGPGGAYFLHTHRRDQGEPFLKQGYLSLRQSGVSVTVGRFEHSEGLETVPADRSLALVKRWRIAERLVGPFGYTHVTRSFDGARVSYDRPAWNATALAARPTHGGFEVSANRELADVGIAGLALTAKRLLGAIPSDARLFHLYYEDRRDAPVKVDNRPLDARSADHHAITIHTVGGHLTALLEAGPGAADALFWWAVQAGDWGRLDHGAEAFAAEAGYQLDRLRMRPWLRIGYDRSSGDDDPLDSEHRTFFQVLPTSRAYAQLPFFNLMNDEDLFAQVFCWPHASVLLRTEAHRLRLTEPRDLWYAGGGATNRDVFGFSGIPASGHRELAYLVDLSATVTLAGGFSVYGYYGHAFGQGVVRSSFAGSGADYGYVDLVYRY